MISDLDKLTVLVLNKNWQAINVTTPTAALSMMYADTAVGLDVGEEGMTPYKWSDWITLSAENSECIATVNSKIKIPKVIILSKYSQVPLKRPRLNAKNIWERDKGTCQYTGKKLTPNEGNIDHVVPRSKGGKTCWNNVVLCHKDVNAKKADKTPSEAGLKLINTPKEPVSLPVTIFIKNRHNLKEWAPFLVN